MTGGAGFVGSALVRHLLDSTTCDVLILDKLDCAGDLPPSQSGLVSDRIRSAKVDICDCAELGRLLGEFAPDAVMHLAAETHVDTSIMEPDIFVRTNVVGTFSMLNSSVQYWRRLTSSRRKDFRFLHISTDEVFGDAGYSRTFHEGDRYGPRSPYAATKAAADHLVHAWHTTYGLPTITTYCTNNFGPFQDPEKLIPKTIVHCLTDREIPVYGKGLNVRDWIYVDDHVSALHKVVECAAPGDRFLIGARSQRENLDIVLRICKILDRLVPRPDGHSYRHRIRHVGDRSGHDFRYAADPSKCELELGWAPQVDFETALEMTVQWYVDNPWWWRPRIAAR